MGNVLSSDTIYAVAYLTDLGRKLIFDPIGNNRFTESNNGIIDAFKIVYFSASDPDYNYNVTQGIEFETGDIANISGKNDDCIKGTVVSEETNLISVNGEVGGILNVEDEIGRDIDNQYVLSTEGKVNVVSINISSIPIIKEQ